MIRKLQLSTYKIFLALASIVLALSLPFIFIWSRIDPVAASLFTHGTADMLKSEMKEAIHEQKLIAARERRRGWDS